LIGDCSRDELDPDALHVRTLELLCARAGIGVLALSARGVAGIGEVVSLRRPDAVVLAGAFLPDDELARWAYAVRIAAGSPPVCVFRRSEGKARRPAALSGLPPDAASAQQRLLELVDLRLTDRLRPFTSRTVIPIGHTGTYEIAHAAHRRRA
jgi:hypothetical protein